MDRPREDSRPDPDAVLALTESEDPQRRIGLLKIFFGMSPGVGKTFAMLQEARQKSRGGVETVLGYVETHARPEPVALKAGLE